MSWLAKYGLRYGAPVGILFCFVVLALHMGQAVPLFENSDEAEHFLYAHTLASTGEIPLIQPREQLNEADSPLARWNNHAHHPPLYYAITALAIGGFDRSHLADYLRPNDLIFTREITAQNPNKWLHSPQPAIDETPQALQVARWLNTAFGLITLCLIYKAGLQTSHKRSIGLLAMAFAAALPTFISIHSSVSNDPLVVLTFSAGVLWCLRLLHRRRITWRDDLLISLILAAAALSKLTGAALWGVVLLALLLAIWRGRLHWQRAIQTLLIAVVLFAILAGWWYVRNWQLYGDPLALDATAAMWGRTFDDIQNTPLEEIQRVALSYWMMVGYRHQPVFAPDWFYALAACLVGSSLIGWLWPKTRPLRWPDALVLLATLGGMIALLVMGTLNVDISYGRLLLPAIVPVAVLLAIGWHQLPLKLGPLFLIGYVIAAAVVLIQQLPQRYPLLKEITAQPQAVTPTDWRAGNLAITGIDVHTTTLAPGEPFTFELYLRGSHPLNPALSATLIDSITGEPLGQADVYPGMAPTNALPANVLYHAPVTIPLTLTEEALSPRALLLQLRWYDVADAAWVAYDTGPGTLQDVALLRDPRYTPTMPAQSVDVAFGDAITLEGYDLTDTTLAPGDEPLIDLLWHIHQRVEAPYVLTLQLFNEAGDFITQADGPITGLPTYLWQGDLQISETRALPLPPDLPPGTYTIRMGWYHLDNWTRWPVTGGSSQDDLYTLPQTLVIHLNT